MTALDTVAFTVDGRTVHSFVPDVGQQIFFSQFLTTPGPHRTCLKTDVREKKYTCFEAEIRGFEIFPDTH